MSSKLVHGVLYVLLGCHIVLVIAPGVPLHSRLVAASLVGFDLIVPSLLRRAAQHAVLLATMRGAHVVSVLYGAWHVFGEVHVIFAFVMLIF